MSSLASELRLALRALARQPLFAFSAIATLGLAIAAATIVFSVGNAVLLRPLSFPESERLVQVYETELDRTNGVVNNRGWFAWQNYADIRDRVPQFDALAAWQYYDRTLTGVENATLLAGRMVTREFFRVFGVPQLGRGIEPGDAVDGAQRVAVIGHGVWQRLLGGESGIIGRVIRLDGEEYEVIGVMPAGFDHPAGGELWMPLTPFLGEDGIGARRFHRYRVAGRLAESGTIEGAQAALTALARRLEAAYPETNRDNGFAAVALHDVVVGEARPALRALGGAVAFLLVIACANVAGLQLARAVERERELGVRTALGAPRRLVAGLLTESLVLAAFGGVAGVVLAVWGLQSVLALLGDALPRAGEVTFDRAAFGFAALTTLSAGLAFGLAPAVRHSPDRRGRGAAWRPR